MSTFRDLDSDAPSPIAGQDHGLLSGLTDDDHTQYALVTARTGGNVYGAREQWKKGADVASASTLTLGSDGNTFVVTGTTTINHITFTNWQAGSVIRLIFASSIVVNNNAGSPPANTAALLLKARTNTQEQAGYIMELLYDGTNFVEMPAKEPHWGGERWNGFGSDDQRLWLSSGNNPRLEFNGSYVQARSGNVDLSASSGTGSGDTILSLNVDNTRGPAAMATDAVKARMGGTLKTIQSDTGNVGAGEDDLHSYTLPAAVLSADGQSVQFETTVTIAANANSKRVRVYFGATAIYDSTAQAQSGTTLRVVGRITRTGAVTQRASTDASLASAAPLFTVGPLYTTPAETLSGTVVIKVTGEAVANNDLVNVATVINWLPANN